MYAIPSAIFVFFYYLIVYIDNYLYTINFISLLINVPIYNFDFNFVLSLPYV